MEKIGKYQVQKLVRSSSCSDLYLCVDPDFDMQVAVKLFAYDDGNTKRMNKWGREFWLNRFVIEAQLLARLDHPNIIAVRELSYLDEETPYLVMPFIEANLRYEIGHDIPVPLSEYKGRDNDPLSPKVPSLRRTLDLLIGLSDALSYLHANGFVHRDIKPGNVLLTKRQGGWPKVCDFGFTFRIGKENPDLNFWLGTKHYISPEQASKANQATPASDIYSLGVMAYRLLCGALPVDDYPKISSVRSDVPEELIDLVDAMMEQDPKERPQNGKIVFNQLKKIDPTIARKTIRLKENKKTVLKLR